MINKFNFKYDKKYDWYEGRTEAFGQKSYVFIDTEKEITTQELIEKMKTVEDVIAFIKISVEELIIKLFQSDIYESCSEYWESEYGDELTFEIFKCKLNKINGLTIYNDESFSVFFDDNGLYFGHEFEMKFNQKKEVLTIGM